MENPWNSYKNGRFGGTLILGNLHVVAPIFFGLSSFFPDNMAIKVINFAHFQTAIWHDQQLDFVLNPTISKITLVKDILVPAVLAPKNEKGADFFWRRLNNMCARHNHLVI